MTPFPLDRLPDDVMGLLVSSFLGANLLKTLSTLDLAYCNQELRQWYLAFLSARKVVCADGDTEDTDKISRLMQWLRSRNVKVFKMEVCSDDAKLFEQISHYYPQEIFSTVESIVFKPRKKSIVLCQSWGKFCLHANRVKDLEIVYSRNCQEVDYPWWSFFQERTAQLQTLSIYYCNSRLSCRSDLCPSTLLMSLKVENAFMTSSELLRLIKLCPKLELLTLSATIEWSDEESWDETAPALLESVRELHTPVDDKRLQQFLLHHAPNISVLTIGKCEWLIPQLLSGCIPHLIRISCEFSGLNATFHLASANKETMLWPPPSLQSHMHQKLLEYPRESMESMNDLEKVMLFVDALKKYTTLRDCVLQLQWTDDPNTEAAFISFWESALSIKALRGLFLQGGVIGSISDWLQVLQLPNLKWLAVYDASLALLPKVHNYAAARKLSLCASSTLESLKCDVLSSESIPPYVVQFMPCLRDVRLHYVQFIPTTGDVEILISGLVHLSSFYVEMIDDQVHWSEEFHFASQISARRPKLTLELKRILPATMAVMASLINGLGDYLQQMTISNVDFRVGDDTFQSIKFTTYPQARIQFL